MSTSEVLLKNCKYNWDCWVPLLSPTSLLPFPKETAISNFSSGQFSHSVMSNSWDPMDCSTPGFPVYHQFPELTQTHVRVGDAIQPSHLLLSLFLLPSIFPSIRVFSKESVLYIRWPKYWSFSFSNSPSNEYSGLISFTWLDLLAVQGTLKSLLQQNNSKASVFWCSSFFIVQLSHPYLTTGETIALTRWTFVGKVISLLINMLYRFVLAFLSWSKHLLISWLHSPSAVIFGAQENKAFHCFHGFPSICYEVIWLDAMIFIFWMLSFNPAFSLSSFTFIKRCFTSSSPSAMSGCHLHIWGYYNSLCIPSLFFHWTNIVCLLHSRCYS